MPHYKYLVVGGGMTVKLDALVAKGNEAGGWVVNSVRHNAATAGGMVCCRWPPERLGCQVSAWPWARARPYA